MRTVDIKDRISRYYDAVKNIAIANNGEIPKGLTAYLIRVPGISIQGIKMEDCAAVLLLEKEEWVKNIIKKYYPKKDFDKDNNEDKQPERKTENIDYTNKLNDIDQRICNLGNLMVKHKDQMDILLFDKLLILTEKLEKFIQLQEESIKNQETVINILRT